MDRKWGNHKQQEHKENSHSRTQGGMREATNVSYQECVHETWGDCVTLCVLTAQASEWEQKQQKELTEVMTDNFSELKEKCPQIIMAHSTYEEPNKK